MSLVIYRKGELAVDRSGLDIRHYRESDVFIPAEVKKFHVTKDRKIAVAYTGPEIDFTSGLFTEQMVVFRSQLKKLKGTDGVSLEVVIHPCFKNDVFFVMTSEMCYEIIDCKEGPIVGIYTAKFHPLKDYPFVCHGSGGGTAEYLLSATPELDTHSVFTLVATYTPAMWVTEIDSITHAELKPL